ncbi:hypothetical protein J437_LFUL008605 [Ladona fulva]|uniref:p53 DNA-binding domain-containing protein n=1 Tax=Ladona fulva TaxID=123851 RepID=A0A8K0KAZ8_LADFU|nr:hypothetical protein J437_LFUL008605 [Ladona fulva]
MCSYRKGTERLRYLSYWKAEAMVTKGEEFQSSQDALLSENELKYIQEQIGGSFDWPTLTDVGGRYSEEEKFKVAIPPSPTSSLPSAEEWDGPYDFQLLVNTMNANKKTWLHSSSLNKIFIDVNKSIPLQFKINCPDDGEAFFIRALPVYTISQHMTYPVNRCPLHLKEDESKGLASQNHVVRCEDFRALYECDEESKRYSVVTPLGCPQPGSDVVTLMYSFACKSSCCGGMNRRPVMVIFTLEKDNLVVGRKTMNFRVCSCPKRDKEKEEKSALEEKLQNNPGKKPMEAQNQKESSMNCIQGAAHYREILRYLIMLKNAEYLETGSQEALSAKEEYEGLCLNGGRATFDPQYIKLVLMRYYYHDMRYIIYKCDFENLILKIL